MTQPNETPAASTDATINDLLKRVAQLEARLQDHMGDAQGSSGQFYQHPIASFDLIEFGGGTGRGSRSGLQVIPTTLDGPAFIFVPQFSDTPSSQYPWGGLGGSFTSTTYSQVGIKTRLDANSSALMFAEANSSLQFANVHMQSIYSGSTVSPIFDMTDDVANGRSQFVFTNAPIVLVGMTADPPGTIQSGSIWYRSDLGAFRFRAGGVTSSLTLP